MHFLDIPEDKKVDFMVLVILVSLKIGYKKVSHITMEGDMGDSFTKEGERGQPVPNCDAALKRCTLQRVT